MNQTIDYYLPSDRVSFENQEELLRAYVSHSGDNRRPVSIQEVSKNVPITSSTASLANSFFAKAGFLEKDGKNYIPANEVFNYKNDYDLGLPNPGTKLVPLVSKTWFWNVLRPILDQRPMEENEVISVLSETGNFTKKHWARLTMLIQYLELASMIKKEGTLITMARDSSQNYQPDTKKAVVEETKPPRRDPDPPRQSKPTFSQKARGITVDVFVDPEQLKGWTEKRFEKFFGGIATVVSQALLLEEDDVDF